MFYNTHTHANLVDKNVLSIVNQYPSELNLDIPFYSVGIHPWFINLDNLEAELAIIDRTLAQKNCLALGECGLDKRIEMPLDKQIFVFKEQIKIAKKHKKPLILHCVSAFNEVIVLKKEMQIEVPIVIHGFSKNIEIAKSLISNGIYLSFGKYLLRNIELASVFENVPNDKILLETDTIDETIFEVYSKAKQIKKVDLELLIENNFKKIFNLI